MKFAFAVAFAAAAAAQLASAAQIHVPGDFAVLQDAIDAAAPNDVIIVHGGTHDPITITKPLTIVGQPMAAIDNTLIGSPAHHHHQVDNVTLLGPGAGRVTLVNLDVKGVSDLGFHFSSMGSRIAGGGFAELLVLDCKLRPPTAQSASGGYQSRDCVSIGASYVLFVRSEATGAPGGTDVCGPWPSLANFAGKSGAGIRASGATVVVLDSVVRGGEGADLCFYPSCPPSGSAVPGGGDGISAAKVFHSGSVIEGGAGVPIYCDTGSFPLTYLGDSPPGVPIVAPSVIALDAKFLAPLPPVLGGNWQLSWTTTGNPTLLLVGLPGAPLLVPGNGWLFLQSTAFVVTTVPGGAQIANIPVPATPALAGAAFTLQLLDPLTKLTRPVTAALLP